MKIEKKWVSVLSFLGLCLMNFASLSMAQTSQKADLICKKPSADIQTWQDSDWHFCRSKIKRACVNDHPFADGVCAQGVMEQTPECHAFSGLLKSLNTTLDLLTWEDHFPLALISQRFPGDGGENYIVLTPFCEVNFMEIHLGAYDATARASRWIHFSKPIFSKNKSNIQVSAPYRIQSCKACAIKKEGVLLLQYDLKGKLEQVGVKK